MAMDYVGFTAEILTVLQELGNTLIYRMPGEVVPGKTGKKVVTSYSDYTAIGVQGRYNDDEINESGPIQAGDVKFVIQMISDNVEPKRKSNHQVVFGNVTYNVIEVTPIIPNGTNTVIYLIQGRRVN